MKVLALGNKFSFATWNNLATSYAKTEYILYLNDDVILTKNWLGSMIKILDTKPRVGAVSKKMYYTNLEPHWHCESNRSGPVKEAPATCLLVRRPLAIFNGKFKGYYYEDIELTRRIQKEGRKVWAERRYPILHIGGATFSRLSAQEKTKLINLNTKAFDEITGIA
jgi:GT2 family glycosyltransferase